MSAQCKSIQFFLLILVIFLSLTTLLLIPDLLCAAAPTDIPQYINYQGRLTSSKDGTPISEVLTMHFRLYTVENPPSTDNGVYEQANVPVYVENGLFSVELGPIPTEVFANNPQLYIGIKIGGNPEMRPLQKITSVAYAYKAEVAKILKNGGGQLFINTNGYVGIGTVSPSQKLEVKDGSILINNGRMQLYHPDYPENERLFALAPTDLLDGTKGYKFSWRNDDGTNAGKDPLYFHKSGNIYIRHSLGIGTDTPSQKLEVRDGSILINKGGMHLYNPDYPENERRFALTPTDLPGGTNGYKFSWRNDDGTHAGKDPLYFHKSGNIYIRHSLGIGTDTPSQKLEVRDGSILINNGSLQLYYSGGEADKRRLVFMTTKFSDNSYGFKFSWRKDDISFAYDSICFHNSGDIYIAPHKEHKIGIGTMSPSQKLEVKDGNIKVTNGAISLDCSGDLLFNCGPADEKIFQLTSDWVQTGSPFITWVRRGYKFSWIKADGTTERISAMEFNNSGEIYLMGGKVGIKTRIPSFDLHVNGTAGKPGGGSFTDSSDIRLKKNVTNLSGALDKLIKLQGVTFEWINPEEHGNKSGQGASLIAQDVEKVFPEWVSEVKPTGRDKGLVKKEENVKTLCFPHDFNAYVIESIKELKTEIDALKAENAALKARLSEPEN